MFLWFIKKNTVNCVEPLSPIKGHTFSAASKSHKALFILIHDKMSKNSSRALLIWIVGHIGTVARQKAHSSFPSWPVKILFFRTDGRARTWPRQKSLTFSPWRLAF